MFPRSLTARLSLGIAAIGSCGAATLAALHPAAAASVIAAVNTLVSCATATACVTGANTDTKPGGGAGVYGSSTEGDGVYGSSTDGAGVYATSKNSLAIAGVSTNLAGVLGDSYGAAANTMGVYGQSPAIGVGGKSMNANGLGVVGWTTGGTGVQGEASGNGVGAYGGSANGVGVWATSGYGTGLNAISSTGIGVRAHTYGGGFSVVGTSDNGLGNGADFEGGRFGIIGRANPSGYPLVLTDSSYHNVFYVSGTGDVYLHGQLQSFARTASGLSVSSYTPKSAQPTVEDTGSAQLIGGVATVTLDPTFAATVDTSTTYRVFLTPDGDTRGLFVAIKTPRGFIVRETQGGRSTLAFDYRIVATVQGQVGRRMAVQTAAAIPNAPIPPAAAEPRINAPSPPNLRVSAKPVSP